MLYRTLTKQSCHVQCALYVSKNVNNARIVSVTKHTLHSVYVSKDCGTKMVTQFIQSVVSEREYKSVRQKLVCKGVAVKGSIRLTINGL